MALDSKTDFDSRKKIQALPRDQLEQFQLTALQRLLTDVLPENSFYRQKFSGLETSGINDRAALAQLPLTTKAELLADGSSQYAANLTYERSRYVRFHRTSGTQGSPMTVLDTADDWMWWTNAWQYVLDAAQIDQTDTALMAFSFGPFIGFWSAFDAAIERGLTVVPTGAMTTVARLDLIFTSAATVVFCTPSYALHMAEVAAERQIDLRTSGVKKIIVAGEPGGSIPATRDRIESAWGAQVIDHAGASEVGPWGFADPAHQGLVVNEACFLPELIGIEDQALIPWDTLKQTTDESSAEAKAESSAEAKAAAKAEAGLAELVLTTLGRDGCPVIRYRTGDLVRPVLKQITGQIAGQSSFLFLQGGVLGRTDDMMIIRGVNVFPTSVEAILREIPEVVEFRTTAFTAGAMDQLKIEVESEADMTGAIEALLNSRLGLRIEVKHVGSGSLPRFEAKAKRFVDQRNV